MKNKNPAGKKEIRIGRVIKLGNKEDKMIAVIDEEMQKRFPRLVVLSTQVVSVARTNNHQIRDSEPKLLYDK